MRDKSGEASWEVLWSIQSEVWISDWVFNHSGSTSELFRDLWPPCPLFLKASTQKSLIHVFQNTQPTNCLAASMVRIWLAWTPLCLMGWTCWFRHHHHTPSSPKLQSLCSVGTLLAILHGQGRKPDLFCSHHSSRLCIVFFTPFWILILGVDSHSQEPRYSQERNLGEN